MRTYHLGHSVHAGPELGGSRADWSGKIVVDAPNAFLVPNSEQILGGRLSTEFNAEAFPGAAVVKSFNQTAARQLAEKRPPEFGKRVVFVSSNDSAASAVVAGLCTELGFAPIELGRLDEGGVLIQARNALVLRELYELPSELEKNTQVTSAVGRDLTPGTWAIDPVHSSITFSVRHLMVGRVRGRFGDFSGAITVPENGTPSIAATIAVGSVNTGNPDPRRAPAGTRHLRRRRVPHRDPRLGRHARHREGRLGARG